MLKKSLVPFRYVPVFALALLAALPAHAATSPNLGAAETYSVLSGSAITNGGTFFTTITGDMGISPGIGAAPHYTGFPPGVVGPPGTIHDADASAANAQAAQKAVFDGPLSDAQQPCTVTYPVTTNLATKGPLSPGVYCTAAGADFTMSGTVTLRGTGSPATDVWIFRSSRDLIGEASANIIFTGTGGYGCNVWWRVARTATFTPNNAIIGNILAATSITFGQGATLNGRAFAYTAEVTFLGNTVSGPTCSSAPAPAMLRVIKQVVNDDGGTSSPSAFQMHVKLLGLDVVGSPAAGTTAGTDYSLTPGTYAVSEDYNASYAPGFSGDCDVSGNITLLPGASKTCTITNNDSVTPVPPLPSVAFSSNMDPPLINLRKVPAPLALPAGPGPVTYGYTVTNPGSVALTDITLLDDQCMEVAFTSGDANGNGQLDTNETWLYRCTTTLSKTTVNYATVRGLGNGMAAVDTSIAEVVVGVPVVPPLIHIIKTSNPLLLPFNGGPVTYTYTVHNPGTVALNDVTVTDDTCTNVRFLSGDVNGDSVLQPAEEWSYACSMNIPFTKTNTAIATGHANGLTAMDTALITVVVAGSPVPPLIHLIKQADPVILPAEGGLVTYTYSVTNPGTIPLNNVGVADDHCGPVSLVSGDTNGNGLMEINETWIYTCRQTLTGTTTNIATATGHGNGLTVTSAAIASVVLSPALIPPTPKLPNTGFAPGRGPLLPIVILSGLSALLLLILIRWKYFLP